MGPKIGGRRKTNRNPGSKFGVDHLSKGDIRRLARRGGIRRMTEDVYDETKLTILNFLSVLIKDAVIYAEH